MGLVSEHRLPGNWSVGWELVRSCSVCSIFFRKSILRKWFAVSPGPPVCPSKFGAVCATLASHLAAPIKSEKSLS